MNRAEIALKRSEKERAQQGRRIYHLRLEIGELVRQVKALKEDDRTKDDLRKEVKGIAKTLRSERYIHRQELDRIRAALCDNTDCACCPRLRASLPDGGPFQPTPGSQEGTK